MLKFFCWFWIWYQIQYFQQFHKYPNCFIISLHNNCNNNFFSSVDPVKKKLLIFRYHVSETSNRGKKKEKKKLTATIRVVTAHKGTGRVVGRGTETRVQIPTWRRSRILAGGREGFECTPLRSRSVTFSTLTSAKHISAHFAVREWMAQIKKRFLKFSDK